MSTPIKFEDIRVGDRVRGIDHHDNGTTVTVECVVTDLDDNWFTDGGNFESFRAPKTTPGVRRTFELIERPKPEFKPGQIWRHRVSGNRYLILEIGNSDPLAWGIDSRILIAYHDFDNHLTYVGEAEITVKQP
ncbi:hypothetical protein [Nakamurella lactea]|uniref:hypothetical protein n=1 Tax=Nakamurella lactea TaxID=459515 RepID=UPI000428DFB8|nr:hypothetical protein [Nakamurella lactea]